MRAHSGGGGRGGRGSATRGARGVRGGSKYALTEPPETNGGKANDWATARTTKGSSTTTAAAPNRWASLVLEAPSSKISKGTRTITRAPVVIATSASNVTSAGNTASKGKKKPVPTKGLALDSYIDKAFAAKKKKKSISGVALSSSRPFQTIATTAPGTAQSLVASASGRKLKIKAAAGSNKHVVQTNPNPLDSSVSTMIRKGKTRMGKKKYRPSTLKKSLVRERLLRLQLLRPETLRVPLQVHPAMFGYLERLRTEDAGDDKNSQEIESNEEEDDAENNENDHDRDEEQEEERDESPVEKRVDQGQEEIENQFSFNARLVSPVYFGYTPLPPLPAQNQQEGHEVKRKKLAHVHRITQLGGPVRDYVTQALSMEMDALVSSMLSRLMELQERVRLIDSVKARFNRRLVLGFHEVVRGIKSRRCKCIIVAPDIEQGSGSQTGGIDDTVKQMFNLCRPNADEVERGAGGVAVVFALSKKKLGAALGKKVKVSVVGIYGADGAYEEYKKVLKLAVKLSTIWEDAVHNERVPKLCCDCNDFLPHLRYDCTECKATRCERCAASFVDKKRPCPGKQSALEKLATADAKNSKKIKKKNEKTGQQQKNLTGNDIKQPEKTVADTCSIVRVNRSLTVAAAAQGQEESVRLKEAAAELKLKQQKTRKLELEQKKIAQLVFKAAHKAVSQAAKQAARTPSPTLSTLPASAPKLSAQAKEFTPNALIE